MKLAELKNKIREYQYLEDEGLIDVAVAAIISNRLKIGRPVWMLMIGASSGGKSQLLRPLALTDTKFIHRVDDLTENTFLSGMATGEGKEEISLLKRIGSRGIIVVSDMTVLMSKAAESRAAILSQFRMIYDGEMTKYSGTKSKAISWKGRLGVLAGSTPSIYGSFEEVADMGERFIYYRMKEYDKHKSMDMFVERDFRVDETDVDEKLAEIYNEYVRGVVEAASAEGSVAGAKTKLPQWVVDRLKRTALLAEKMRTSATFEWRGKDIMKIPVTAYPMRMLGQLLALAYTFGIMKRFEGAEIGEGEVVSLEWCGYSSANEEKRAAARIIAEMSFDVPTRTTIVADRMGLSTEVVGSVLQTMAATGILSRGGDSQGLFWSFVDREEWTVVRRLEGISVDRELSEREVSIEEGAEMEIAKNAQFEEFGK